MDCRQQHEGTIEFYQRSEDWQKKLIFATRVNIKFEETKIKSITAYPITIYESGLGKTDYHTAVITYKDGSTEEVR